MTNDDGGNSTQPATTSPDGPSGSATALQREMGEAVRDALADDVQINEQYGISFENLGYPSVSLELQRGDDADRTVVMDVSLAPARPDLDQFQPCSDPPSNAWQDAESCEEGQDEDGRWRIMKTGSTDYRDVTIVEDDATSVIVEWNDNSDAGESPHGILSEEQAAAIADAVFAVGNQHDTAELMAGFDLVGTLEAWPDMRAALEMALDLGALTPMAPDDAPDGAAYDPETGATAYIDEQWQTGTIAARYATEGGLTVDVALWQVARLYDDACGSGLGECGGMPGYNDLSEADGGELAKGGVMFTPVSGLDVTLETGRAPEDSEDGSNDEASNEFNEKHTLAVDELSKLIRFQGGYRNQSDGRDHLSQ
ncbi:hypothetical protein [Phytoactinopolyspora endophytica]|uniref:hypothetical protein n=1 Tax=Phytoactinopolyspora endophytica TaxID=1642495 RepID=UPI00101C8414|nr:hypothetical protein [Phytoactinopolyspora endophytica]